MTIKMQRPTFDVNLDDPTLKALEVSEFVMNAAEEGNKETQAKLADKKALIEKTLKETEADAGKVGTGAEDFDLWELLAGWFPEQLPDAKKAVVQKAGLKLNPMSAATFGNMTDAMVRAMVKQDTVRATGEAKIMVAKTLDQATGVANRVANDEQIRAKAIEDKANEILNRWQGNVSLAGKLFDHFYQKLLNRVMDHQNRLMMVGAGLAKNSVMMQTVYAAIQARSAMTLQALYETCVAGVALAGSDAIGVKGIIAEEEAKLARLEEELAMATGAAKSQLNIECTSQRSFVNLLKKRLIDMKTGAVRLQGFYGTLGTVADSVAVIEADVEYGRTNVVGMLGMQLNLVCEIAAALRVNRATQNLREADARAAENVGVATDALQVATQETLLNVETGMRALEATIQATIKGSEYSKANYEKMLELVKATDAKLLEAVRRMGEA